MMLSNVELVFCGCAEREAPIWFFFFFFRQRVLAPWRSVKNKVKISEVKGGQYSEVKSHYGQIISESRPWGE